MRRVPAAVIALAIAAGACQPFYRDDLRAGRRARGAAETMARARAAYAAGDARRAIALAERALAARPDALGPEDHLMLGRALASVGRHDAARRLVRRGIDWFGIVAPSEFHDFVVASWLAEGRVADALDELGGTAGAALERVGQGALAAAEGAPDPIAAYAAWLDEYGIPDHPGLRDARDRILASPSRAHDAARAADAHFAAGRTGDALALYSIAWRFTPPAAFAAHLDSFVAAARTVADPEELDPVAYRLAADGSAAQARGELAAAMRLYRRAVARAPWWGVAHRNLALLFEQAGRKEEARLEHDWADRLGAPSVAPAERAPPASPDRPGGFRASRVRGSTWIVLGGGAAVAATGALFLSLASAKQDEIDAAPTDTIADIERLRELEAEGRRHALLGNVFLIAGGVAVLAGGALLVYQGFSAGGEHRISIVPMGDGAGLILTGTLP